MEMNTLHRCRQWFLRGVLVSSLCIGAHAFAGPLTVPHTFVANTPAVANDVNQNFSAVKSAVDDNDSRITAAENDIANLQAGTPTTVIESISWQHGGTESATLFNNASTGLAFWLSRPVIVNDLLDPVSVNPIVELYLYVDGGGGTGSWQKVTADLTLERLSSVGVDAYGTITSVTPNPNSDPTTQGFRLVLNPLASAPPSGLYKIVVHGNFISDENSMALDADFLLGQLPSGDGAPGGTFVSWFTL